jgi:hypothetical protein
LLAVAKTVASQALPQKDYDLQARKVDETDRAVAKALEVAREVQADCAAALKELNENKASSGLIARMEERVGKPFSQAVKDGFPEARKALGELRAALEAVRAGADKTKGAGETMDRLLDRLGAVVEGLEDSPSAGALIARLSEIERG